MFRVIRSFNEDDEPLGLCFPVTLTIIGRKSTQLYTIISTSHISLNLESPKSLHNKGPVTSFRLGRPPKLFPLIFFNFSTLKSPEQLGSFKFQLIAPVADLDCQLDRLINSLILLVSALRLCTLHLCVDLLRILQPALNDRKVVIPRKQDVSLRDCADHVPCSGEPLVRHEEMS